MQRTEVEVVAKTLAVLEKYEANPGVINSLDIRERIASRMMLQQLRQLMTQFAASQVPATQRRFIVFTDYLRHWNRLIGTPFLLCYQPNALANQAIIALIKDLKTVFPYTELELALPKAIIPEGFESDYYNNFVVTEDGYLIGVLEGLEALKNHRHHLFLDPAGKDLDPDLLMEHSSSAQQYAMKIRNLFRPKDKDFEECGRLRADLEIFINETYNYQRLTPAHGDEGKKRLMRVLTRKIHTPQQLAEFLDAYVQKDEWAEFLQAMDRDELCRIVIPMRGQALKRSDQTPQKHKEAQDKAALQAILVLLESSTDWPASDNAKRILLYIMSFTYHLIRKDASEYTDYAAGWLGGYSKTQVLQQTKFMQDFLLGDADMRDLEAHLQKQVDEKKMLAINSTTCLALKNKILEAGQHCAPRQEEVKEETLSMAPSLSQ